MGEHRGESNPAGYERFSISLYHPLFSFLFFSFIFFSFFFSLFFFFLGFYNKAFS